MFRAFICVLMAGMFFLPASAQAQTKSFEKGDILLSPGIGYGTHISGYGFFRPNFTFNADFGVHDYVSVGPAAGFAFASNATAFSIGARASFHWWQLMDDKVEKDLKQDQIDFYLPVWIGARILTNKNGRGNTSGVDGGAGLGLRWYPNANQRFALFGEWGRGAISWGNVGMTIKVR